MAIDAVNLHDRLDAAKQLRNLADDIESAGLSDVVKVVSVVEWPGEIEIYAGGKIPSLSVDNLILDFGKKRLVELEYPE